MKRLVTICFALVVISVLPANAALQMVVTGGYQDPEAPKTVGVIAGDIVQIDIVSDTSGPLIAFFGKDAGIGHLYPVTPMPPIIITEFDPGWYEISNPSPVQPGLQVTFNFVYDNYGQTAPYSTVTLLDSDAATVLDSYYFYDIPEPASAALLGAGSLLAALRRKKSF